MCNNFLKTSLSPCLSLPLRRLLLKFRESYLNELDSERAFYFEVGIEATLAYFIKLVSERFQFQNIGIKVALVSTNWHESRSISTN